ncbi:MAG: T9SS type A sorting domain-containing protein [Bacteroidota bacterium]
MGLNIRNVYFVPVFLLFFNGKAQLPVSVVAGQINASKSTNRNINHPEGSFYQDVKKSTVQILCLTKDGVTYGTGVLLNTVKNTYSNTGVKYYIITADHVVRAVEYNTSNIYMSFEYEMPHSMERGGSRDAPQIATFYHVPVKLVVSDPAGDIALLEIDPTILSPLQSAVFQNAFAAGWTLNPPVEAEEYVNISHPKGDHKKVFTGPLALPFYRRHRLPLEDEPALGPNLNFQVLSDHWSNNASLEAGSSGSGFYDTWGYPLPVVGGIYVSGSESARTNSVSLLENSWKLPDRNGLQHYLDPDNTWISSVNGGYVKELIPNDPANFDISLARNGSLEQERPYKIEQYFNFREVGKKKEITLGSGILSGSGDAKIYLTLTLTEDPGYLLYGIEYDPLAKNSATVFQGKPWYVASPPLAGMPGSSNNLSYSTFDGRRTQSSNIKTLLTQYIRSKVKGSLRGFVGNSMRALIYANLPLELKLFRPDDGISTKSDISAFKLPFSMPFNAAEVFEPNKLVDLWRSQKYRGSRGSSSDKLYIDKVVALDKEVSTGDNGGYLNMVNTNFTLGPFKASTAGKDEYLDLSITVKNKTGEAWYYKVWVDYIPAVNTNYYYNFVGDGNTYNASELVGSGQGTGEISTISIHSIIPNDKMLDLQHDENRNYRMRIALSRENVVSQNGVYAEGEVEDYQLNLASSFPAALSAKAQESQVLNAEPDLLPDPVLFPNPVTEIIKLFVTTKKPGSIKISILDLTGKIVYSRDVTLPDKGKHVVTLRDTKLNAAVYVLKIDSEDLRWATKFVVM